MAKDRLLRGAKQIAGCVFKDRARTARSTSLPIGCRCSGWAGRWPRGNRTSRRPWLKRSGLGCGVVG